MSTVLAAPVSTTRYVSVAVTNASSCREVSCTQSSDAEPKPLLDLQLDHARVHEAELAMWMLAPELAVALHCCPAIRADVDHRDAIKNTMIIFRVCVQGLDSH